MTIDSRPSDAIALALRTKSPIFVEEKVIEAAKKLDLPDPDKIQNDEKTTMERLDYKHQTAGLWKTLNTPHLNFGSPPPQKTSRYN